MASYDYRANEGLAITGRFQGADIAHQDLWTNFSRPGMISRAPDFLGRQLDQRSLAEPRLFISHKSTDTPLALQVVDWCDQAGLDFWLDILDPELNAVKPSSPAYAVTIATIIEMALLNSTHVLVLYTDKTATSRWVPYEYGRVKIPNLRSLQAAAWNMTTTVTLPEYLYLGEILESDQSAEHWVKSI